MSNASFWEHQTGFSWEGSCSNVGDKTNIGILRFEFWCKLKTQNLHSHIIITTSHNVARLPHRSSCFLWKCWLRHMLWHIQRHRKHGVSCTKVFFFSAKVYVLSRIKCAELRPQPNILYSSCWAHRDSLLPEYSNMNEKCFPLNIYRPPRLTFQTRVRKNSSCLSQVTQIKTKAKIEAAIIFYFPFTSGEHTPQETKLLLLNAEVLHSTVVREDRIVDFWLRKM